MKYTKTTWTHEFADCPITYYSKFGDDGMELCRAEIFATGKVLYADHTNIEGDDEAWLSGISFDEVMSSNIDGELLSIEISQEQFDKIWQNPNNPKR